jgi:hypothetical protein
MFGAERELVFIEVNEGVAKESQKPYKFVKLGDPMTYENYKLSIDPAIKIANFSKGEKVKPRISLTDFFGRTQVALIDLIPVQK